MGVSLRRGCLQLAWVSAIVAALLVLSLLNDRHQNNLLRVNNKEKPGQEFGKRKPGRSRSRDLIKQLYGFDDNFSWASHIESLDSERLSPLTKAIQRLIHKHQNPEPSTCASKKFFLGANLLGQGLGSALHVMGFWLAMAIHYDRIVLWHPTEKHAGDYFVDTGCGRGENFSNMDCIFEPLSSTCGYEHVTAENSVIPDPWSPTPGFELNSYEGPPVAVKLLKDAYPHVEFSLNGLRIWWRAQSTAYVARLNRRTMNALRELRFDPHLHQGIIQNDASRKMVHMPFPLPAGTISMHVRHGDKHTEMRLIPFVEYVQKSETFVNQNPLYFRKIMFVSTEDPGVITEAHAIERTITDEGSPDNKWTVFTSNINRNNTSPFDQLERFGRQNTTYHWLLQLVMALECDMWVGTRASNWNRIIDELRCVWTEKCNQPFLEVGDKESWLNYWW